MSDNKNLISAVTIIALIETPLSKQLEIQEATAESPRASPEGIHRGSVVRVWILLTAICGVMERKLHHWQDCK